MSTMQAFYLDMTEIVAAEEVTANENIDKKRPLTAGPHESYQQMLARLSQVTLTELNKHRRDFGWSAWW